MKKIPTLFEREFKDHNVVNVLSNVMKGMEWVLGNEGLATVKYDGRMLCGLRWCVLQKI